VLDQRGIAERFLPAGQEHPNLGYSGIGQVRGDTCGLC
jgi:hypothetical protein